MVTEVYSKIRAKISIKNIVFNTKINVVTSMLWGHKGKDPSYTEDGFQDIVFKIIKLLWAPNVSDYIPLL